MSFRPGGDEVITDQEGRLIVSSSRDGRTLREVTAAQPIYQVAFSSSGARVATSSDRHVDLRDAETWQILAGFDAGTDITALALDELDRVVTGHGDGAIRIWEARTGRLLQLLTGHAAHVSDLELRGATLVTGSWDLTTRVWSFPSGEPLTTLTSAAQLIHSVAMSPDGHLFAIADGSAVVKVRDAERGRLLEQIPTTGEAVGLVFADDGHVVVAGANGRVELVELAGHADGSANRSPSSSSR
jgi:WD40 repeat protein